MLYCSLGEQSRTFLDSIQETRSVLPKSILVMTSIANSLKHVYATFLCIRLDEWNKAIVSTFAKFVAVPHVAKEIQSLL
jgi:hypothetical protein